MRDHAATGSKAKTAAKAVARAPSRAQLLALAGGGVPAVETSSLKAGYGRMEIVHDLDLAVGTGQSLCLIGPNGAGKSTVLHAIYGLARVMAGRIALAGRDIAGLGPQEKLSRAGIAYVLQENSVFPAMTVEENLLLGGFLKPRPADARAAAERVFDRYPRLAQRRGQRAGTLSGGERRLLEISRALVMEPQVLLVDEPSIGLEPRFIAMVFDLLGELQKQDGKTILMVEQNARKGLEFADIGYVLVAGRLARAGPGRALLADPEVGRLFLGG